MNRHDSTDHWPICLLCKGAWNDWGAFLRARPGAATEIMLDMALIGPGARVLDESGRDAAWAEIEQKLRAFEGRAGFEGPCEMVVAIGVK